MKSEFDEYLNMSYVELKNGTFILDNGRYVKRKKINETIDDLSDIGDKNDQIASSAISTGDLDMLTKSNELDNRVDSICAKLELELASPKYREN